MMNSDIAKKRIVKQGWLKKQGGLVKTWHWRWFILNGDCLFYFNKEDDVKILGNIYLPGNRVMEHSFKPEEPDKFLFEILPAKGQTKMSANHESFLLCGITNVDRLEWISVIRKVMYSPIGGAIFGQKLEETMIYERQRGNDIPYIVEQCVEFILENGVETEGILRLAGRTALLRDLKESFDTGEKVIFRKSTHDVHTIASLLKTYFRELPESVVPCDFYQKFMNHALRYQEKEDFEEVENLKKSLEKLPDDNYRILAYVCQFLHRISEKSDVNKMTTWNVATVFGPNIIRHIDDNPTLFMATADLTQVLADMMITHCNFLFPEDRIYNSSRRIRTKNVPVDDLLRMSVVNDSGFELLTPISSSELSGLDVPHPKLQPRKSQSLPRDEPGSRISESKRHGKLNLDIKGKPVEVPSRTGRDAPGSAPIPATRRSRHKRLLLKDGETDSDKSNEVSPTIEGQTKDFLPSDSVLLRSSVRRTQHEADYAASDVPAEQLELVDNNNIEPSNTFQYNQFNETLKMELLNQKNEYAERIRSLEDKYSQEITNLLAKLEAERTSKSVAIEKIMSLQSELTRYQMIFGELDPL